jgi:hypothetical protein
VNALTFNVPDEILKRIDKIAADKGVTIEDLLGEMTAHAVEEFEAHQMFLEMARQGEGEVEEALKLLRNR